MDCSAPNKSCCSLVSSLYVGSLHLRLDRFSRRARRAFIAVAGCRARSLPAMEPTPSTTTPPAIMSDLSLSALPRRSKGTSITSFLVEVKGTPLVHYFDADIFPTFDAMYEVKLKIETVTGTYKKKSAH